MAEDSDLEKTEAASPQKLQKAREEGQVARSRELGTFMLLAAGATMLWATGEALYRSMRGLLFGGLSFDQRIIADLKRRIDALNAQLPTIVKQWSALKRARSRSALLSGAALAGGDLDSEMT